ncbi:MAG: Nicotinate-nucleotide--dimethylbenzimidazole phosphoribosyltransferase [Firmicutes bacterium]|nr:Nicotinate-nucleotide--dimethylbenzimidazole phosphoribosyltransferase [Bacillota bacterium]
MLEAVISQIKPLDSEAMDVCQLRIDNLTKPLGSLSGLEYLARKIAGVTRQAKPNNLSKSIILMAADHGVAQENVSAYSTSTACMLESVCRKEAAINALAAHVNASLVLVDIGMTETLTSFPELLVHKALHGSANLAEGPAMTRRHAWHAMETGAEIVKKEIDKGVKIIGLGDIAVAGTTAATAVIACCSGQSVAALTGRSAGISDSVWQKKVSVIEQALANNCPDSADPLDILAKVGGLDIAGLVGAILASAAGGAVVVIDGVTTAAAALLAVQFVPIVKDYLVASHFTAEPAHKAVLERLDIPAHLHLDFRLGQGTGAALGMTLLDASLCMLNQMKTFGEAAVAVAQDGPGAGRQQQNI